MSAHSEDHNGNNEAVMLVNLIASSVRDVLSEYQKAGHTLPSLDVAVSGPFDKPHLTSPKLSKAIQIIEAACAQLSFTVASPGHVVMNKSYGYEEPVAMQVVTSAKIADILLGKPDGLSVEQLAKRSGLDQNKLGRILRMLATKHCFKEVSPNVFANNRLSLQLVSENPVASYVGHITDESLRGAVYLNETLTDPKTGSSTSPNDSPFYRAHGVSTFGFYDTPAGEKVRDRFSQAMVGWGEVTGRAMLPKAYSWDQVPADSVICDVGGGNGHATLGLIKQFPQLKVVLQDSPAMVQQGRDYWKAEHPEAIEKGRVQFVSLNFFTQQPVENCDYYYLRHVLHDWPLAECLTILRSVRKAMGPKSRVLIHELVLQHAVKQASVENQAPHPLLANYGMGRIRLYHQDMNMMNVCNSQERTLQEFKDMGRKVGLKFEKLWDSGEAGLVEFTIDHEAHVMATVHN